MPLIRNVRQLVTGRILGSQSVLETIDAAALVWEAGRISWVGNEANLPPSVPRDDWIDAGGRLLIPGLIDCHTHLCFGGH